MKDGDNNKYKIKPTWLRFPLDGFSGAGSKSTLHVCVIDSTMLLLYSHFTEEEIKAQRSLSNLHEMKHPIDGSSEGVSRSKSKI